VAKPWRKVADAQSGKKDRKENIRKPTLKKGSRKLGTHTNRVGDPNQELAGKGAKGPGAVSWPGGCPALNKFSEKSKIRRKRARGNACPPKGGKKKGMGRYPPGGGILDLGGRKMRQTGGHKRSQSESAQTP